MTDKLVPAMAGNLHEVSSGASSRSEPYVVVLGIAQDAGFPAAGCDKPCCAKALANPSLRKYAACLAIVDPQTGERWIIDCTPDFREQLQLLDTIAKPAGAPGISGVLLTHAHIGHYLGLAHLGREAMGAQDVPVYAMPRMIQFLCGNAPWEQLVALGQIQVRQLSAGVELNLNQRIRAAPVLVPHRGEYSETVGYRITGPAGTVFYLPDVDGWEYWPEGIMREVESADVLYVDGTFYSSDELPGRDMSLIPHPTITESLASLSKLQDHHKRKVRFIHFNHTNPVLDPECTAAHKVAQAGFRMARQGEITVI
jgi:pyrroloquinoline quinone biosynthesis protein B